MQIIILALGLTLLIELVTIYLRLVSHKKSASYQKKYRIPRTHHSYPGFAILLLDYVYLHNEWLFIIGFALVLSDVIHHLVFEPYIKKHKFDIGMKHHRQAHHYATKLPSAFALIGIGLFALMTPFTPGSWLSVVGVGMLVRKSPKKMFRKLVGRK